MAGALGHEVLAVVGSERHGAVALPLQLEQRVRRPGIEEGQVISIVKYTYSKVISG